MIGIKGLTNQQISELASLATADTKTAPILFAGKTVSVTNPEETLKHINPIVNDLGRSMGLREVAHCESMSDLSTNPMVWLCGKIKEMTDILNDINKPGVSDKQKKLTKLFLKNKINLFTSSLDKLGCSDENKIELLKSIQLTTADEQPDLLEFNRKVKGELVSLREYVKNTSPAKPSLLPAKPPIAATAKPLPSPPHEKKERQSTQSQKGGSTKPPEEEQLQNTATPAEKKAHPLWVKPGQSLYDALTEHKLIDNALEYREIQSTWGANNHLLKKKDFPQKYSALKEINKHRSAPYSNSELALIHKSGLLDCHLKEIEQGNDLRQTTVDVNNTFQRVLDVDNKKLVAPAMNSWGYTCWFNASCNLMLAMLTENNIDQLKRITFDDSASDKEKSLRTGIRDVMVAMCEEYQQISKGEPPHSFAGYQKHLMKLLHELGKVDGYGGVKELFKKEIDQEQQDAFLFLNNLSNVLGIREHPAFSVSKQPWITGKITVPIASGGKREYTITRPSGQAESTTFLKVPVPQKPTPLRHFVNCLSQDGVRKLYNTRYHDPDKEQLRQKLVAFHEAVSDFQEARGERSIREAQNNLMKELLRIAGCMIDLDIPIVNKNWEALENCTTTDRYIQKGTRIDRNQKYAMVDENGTLARPFMKGREELAEGTPVLTSHGYRPGQLYNQELVINADLAIVAEHNPNLQKLDDFQRGQYIDGLKNTFGITERDWNQAADDASNRDITMQQCMDEFYRGSPDNYSWEPKQLEDEGIPIEKWYPLFIQQKGPEMGINLDDVHRFGINNACPDATACYTKHMKEEIPEKIAVTVKLPGERYVALSMDTKKCRQFPVSLQLFEYAASNNIKRGDDAFNAFASCQGTLSLSVTDEAHQKQVVRGRIKSLICHEGAGTQDGHYINLTFDPKKGVIVQDDDVVLKLEDYAKEKNLSTGLSHMDLLKKLKFTPYVALFERAFQEK